MDVWVEHEVDGGEFPDQRLKSRLGKVLGELGRRIGNTVPTACQDWAATKAAYRFFRTPESMRRSSWQVTLPRPRLVLPKPKARSWRSTTRPSSPSRAKSPTRSVRHA